MSLEFTTLSAIDTRLKQRIQRGGLQAAFGKSVIDDADVEQIAEQVEARVNNELKKLYRLPLKLVDSNARKALASIVEKLTVCEILTPYFFGASPSDEGGIIKDDYCEQGMKELDALMSSFIDGEVAIGVTIGATNRAPVVGKRTGGTVVDF